MFKRIDFYVFRSLLGPFLFSFAISMFILVLVAVYPYMNEIAGKGIGPEVLGKLIYYASGRVFLMALPVAIMSSSLMTFGALGEKNELAAMKSSGISLTKLMRSTLVFAVLMTIFCVWFSFEVVPRANLKFFALFYDITRKKAELAIKPGFFYDGIDDYVIRVSDKDKETGTLYDVLIYNHTDSRANPDIIRADSARMYLKGSVMRMVFYHGSRYEDLKSDPGKADTYQHTRTYFDSLYYRFTLKGFELERTEENKFKHQIVLRRAQLLTAIDSLERLGLRNRRNHLDQLSRYSRIDTHFTAPEIPLRTLEKARQKAERNAQQAIALPDTISTDPPADTIRPELEFTRFVSLDIDTTDHLVRCFALDNPGREADLFTRTMTSVKAARNTVAQMIKKNKSHTSKENRYNFEYLQRHALPLNCIVFMLIGVSLGAIIRRGGIGPPAIISVVLFILFYFLTTYGRKMVKQDNMEPWIGAWISILVFAPIGLYFMIQATAETSLFNESFWHMQRDRIRQLLSRKKSPTKQPKGPSS